MGISAKEKPNFGELHTWQNVFGSRMKAVIFTNNTGAPLLLYVAGACGTAYQSVMVTIDGVDEHVGSKAPAAGNASYLHTLVPNGSTYNVNVKASGTLTISAWLEYRV